MRLSFLKTAYKGEIGINLTWLGLECKNSKEFHTFLNSKVLNRFNDVEFDREMIVDLLKSLELTEMGMENLEEAFNSIPKEKPVWAASEALTEAYLEGQEGVIFPWNMGRDLRNHNASLQGPDLVGIVGEGPDARFAFGEVKSSSQLQFPPNVTYDLRLQLEKLINEPKTYGQLIKWLYPRVLKTPHRERFEYAATRFFNTGKNNFVLYGMLIRDTKAEPKDLSVMGNKLKNSLSPPTKCQLTALYLPWGLQELNSYIKGFGAL